MSTTPDGQYAKVLVNLQTLVASSATFQASVGAINAEAAVNAIYWMGMEPPDNMPTPWAWIRLRPGIVGDAPSSGGDGFWHRFPLSIMVYRPDAAGTAIAKTDELAARNAKHKERIVAFLSWLGACVREWEALAKTNGHLSVTQFSLELHQLSNETETTRYQMATIGVQVE